MKLYLVIIVFFIVNNSLFAQIKVKLVLPDNCSAITSLNQVKSENQASVNLYPNPTKRYLGIKISANTTIEDATIEIFSMDSRKVFSEKIYCPSKELIKQIDLLALSPQSYVLKITCSDFVDTQSFIVNKN